jgi:hypothetical protein
MFFTLLILVLLVLATPVAIIIDGPIVQGVVAAIAAVSVGIIALRIRPGEAGFLSRVIRPVVVVAAVPAIWMLVQVIPMQNVGLANPVWKSAAAALGQPLAGTISIDLGATFISFTRYLSAVAIAFVAAAIAIDRRRAEWVLLALTTATTLIALMALMAHVGVFAFLSVKYEGQAHIAAVSGASLGIIFATAAALHVSEQSRTRQKNREGSTVLIRSVSAACLVAFAICFVAVIVEATGQTYYAIVCGVATFAITIIIRRFSLGPWGIAAIVSVALFVAIGAVVLQSASRTLDLTLAFASQGPTPLIMVTQRILAETSWAGTGAGTFAAVLPTYQNIDELTTGEVAPTAAAAIAVEMGRPFSWVILAAVIALVLVLMRGALRRQRDSHYSTAGASCIVTTALLSFGNSALLTTPISIVVAVAIGIAVAQSKSRVV